MNDLKIENKYLHNELESTNAELLTTRDFIKHFNFENMSNRRVERELKQLKITHDDHM